MTQLEALEQKVYDEGIPVLCYDFSSLPLKALWVDGTIILSRGIKNVAEKRCVLMEEYCHHRYTVGNALRDTKQEAFARGKAYERLVPSSKIKEAIKAGCCTTYEIAEQLEVTEEMLVSALEHYKAKGII